MLNRLSILTFWILFAASPAFAADRSWWDLCGRFATQADVESFFPAPPEGKICLHHSCDHDGLSAAERAAIYDYTGDDYQCFNQALREQGRKLEVMKPAIDFLVGALEKLPNYVGTVDRGTSLPPAVLQKYEAGQVVVENSFTSTTAPERVDLAIPIPSKFAEQPDQFKIRSRTGKLIQNYSAYGDTEAEVLFLPGARFRVLKATEFNGQALIELQEEP